jgi:multidrug efflux system outer membrane protein
MRAQRARAEQAQHAYIAVLQNAFREVEDALVGIEYLREEREARRRQVVAASNAARLSRARYDGGVVDYLEVLDSERSQFEAELAESAIRRDALTAYVTLYKALGGGWTPESDDDDQVEEEEDADESKPGDETKVETVETVEDDEGTTIQQSASRSTTGN